MKSMKCSDVLAKMDTNNPVTVWLKTQVQLSSVDLPANKLDLHILEFLVKYQMCYCLF